MGQFGGGRGTIRRVAVIVGMIVVLGFGALTWGTLSEAGNTALTPGRSESIEALAENPKLTAPLEILKDFNDGKSRTRVIVNLCSPKKDSLLQNFTDMAVRQELRRAVREVQDRVISGLVSVEAVITNRFTYQFGFSADVSLKGLQDLVHHVDVLSIEPDRILHAHLAQGIDLMNATGPRNDYSGAGLAVAICDTGIDYTHSMLGGGGFPNSKVIGGYDCGDDDPDPMDQHGHGTACAGIAAGKLSIVGDYVGGVALGAKLYALKISHGSGGSAYASDMIEGWEWCITHQNDDPDNPILMISTSFGEGRFFSTCDSESVAMTAAAASAVAAGMTLFVSSGNDGFCDAIGAPACISHVVSVGAVYDAHFSTKPMDWCVSEQTCAEKSQTFKCTTGWRSSQVPYTDEVAVYSNTASFLSLLAPSNWATTTELGGGYYSAPYGFGGTSAACAYAAGAATCLQNAAKVISGSYLTPAGVKSTLISSGDLIPDSKVSISKPRVNLDRAIDSLVVIYVDPAGSCTGYAPCTSTIQGAINLASTGAALNIAGGIYPEDVSLNADKFLTIKGGYNANYSEQTMDTVCRSLTIGNGKAAIDKVTLADTPVFDAASMIFYNNVFCGENAFTAALTINDQTLTSISGQSSNCEDVGCDMSANWNVHGDAGACGIVSQSGEKTLTCECLYEFVLDLSPSDDIVLSTYSYCPGDCSDVVSLQIGERQSLDSVTISKNGGLRNLEAIKP